MEDNSYVVDYDKWQKVIYATQLFIVSCVFVVEILDNMLLYITRSQGYGPDTIVEKLTRYLLITTVINFGSIFVSRLLVERSDDVNHNEFVTMFATVIICTDVAFSHYQFTITFAMLSVPVLLCIFFENQELASVMLFLSLIGEAIALVARGIDPGYNTDIGPEAVIAIMFTIGMYIIARIIIQNMIERRTELSQTLIKAQIALATEDKMKLSLKMFETLAKTIDAKDKYSSGHSARVAIYATKLAEQLGWEQHDINILKYEALLHDIGKIGVPDAVLNKPDKLTTAEFNLIKGHTLVGADILKDLSVIPNAMDVANYHHERYDGKGYPTGIEGEGIPLHARIVCIADSYDAMSSDRIYRDALPEDIIRSELIKGRGTQFDPELLDIFLRLFDEHKLDISVDTTRISESDSEHKYVMEDIARGLRTLTQGSDDITYKDFNKFYKYMRNIGIRYNRTIEVLSIKLSPIDEISIDIQKDTQASKTLEFAIKKNIRSVDVDFEYNKYEHIIILLDAGIGNIDVIAQRILFDFYATDIGKQYSAEYELNENISG